MHDLSNTTLGKYDVIREVGRGSMGVVYLGHDPFTGRDVAIKVALPESRSTSKTNGCITRQPTTAACIASECNT